MARATWRVEKRGETDSYRMVVDIGADGEEELLHPGYTWDGIITTNSKGNIHVTQMHLRRPKSHEAPGLNDLIKITVHEGKTDSEVLEHVALECLEEAREYEERQRQADRNRSNTLANLDAIAGAGPRELG